MASVGVYAEQMFFALRDHHPTNWIRLTQGVLSLIKKYSKEVVDQSCKRALAYETYSYRTVRLICENGTYLLPIDSEYLSPKEEASEWSR
jgi:hypothetical protein